MLYFGPQTLLFCSLILEFGGFWWEVYTSVWEKERKKKEDRQWKKYILKTPVVWKTKDGLSNAPKVPTLLTSEP